MAPDGGHYFGGAKLLFTDARVVRLLIKEGRHRAVARMFGVSEEQELLVTAIALGTLAGAIHRKLAPVLQGPGRPSMSGTVVGASLARESAHAIVGPWSRDTPLFGTMVTLVVLGTISRPVIKVLYHDVRAAAHTARVDFDRRYGHLIRRNRRRRAGKVEAA